MCLFTGSKTLNLQVGTFKYMIFCVVTKLDGSTFKTTDDSLAASHVKLKCLHSYFMGYARLTYAFFHVRIQLKTRVRERYNNERYT